MADYVSWIRELMISQLYSTRRSSALLWMKSGHLRLTAGDNVVCCEGSSPDAVQCQGRWCPQIGWLLPLFAYTWNLHRHFFLAIIPRWPDRRTRTGHSGPQTALPRGQGVSGDDSAGCAARYCDTLLKCVTSVLLADVDHGQFPVVIQLDHHHAIGEPDAPCQRGFYVSRSTHPMKIRSAWYILQSVFGFWQFNNLHMNTLYWHITADNEYSHAQMHLSPEHSRHKWRPLRFISRTA